MVLLAFLALSLAGVSFAALLRSLTLSRSRIAANLEEVAAYGYSRAVPALQGEPAEEHASAFTALAARLGGVVARRLGGVREDELRKVLMAAGMYSASPGTVLGYRVLTAAAFAGLALLMGSTLALHVVLGAVLAALGWVLSLMYIRRRARLRALEVERAIPDLIDQIVVSLEAGIGFSAALQTAAERLGGPLGQEMRLALQEQRMGASLTESLQHVRERIESPNLQSFVRAVVQGERLGVSIGRVMRDLAVDMRKRRRQMAEEQAQKTPVKLLLPLVFLILPTIFIVVLLPPMMTLVHGF